MSDRNIVVAVYDAHAAAEKTIVDLQQAGFDMKKLSIVAKTPHAEEHVAGFCNAGDRVRHRGARSAFRGSMWGLLGPVLVAGPLVGCIVAGLEGATVFGGLSAVGAGLYSIGIPKDSVIEYETAIKTDRFLLLADGTAEEGALAREIIGATRPATLNVYPVQCEGENEREPASARS